MFKKFTSSKKLTKLTQKWGLLFLALSLLVLVILGSQFLVKQKKETKNILPLEKYADQVLAKCAKSNYRPACYDKEIPQLMDFISMEQAFDVTRIVQSKDKSYQYCHVLGHELSARETKKDPSKWQDVVARAPMGICSNGAIHGALQERFRKESLNSEEIEKIKPDLSNVCEKRESWNPTGLAQASCYHALGHLTMYMTKAEIPSSISLCDEVTIKDDGRNFSQLCYDGVYMQLFQPLEPEDFALVEGKVPTKATIDSFCSAYPSPKKDSCHSESWPLFRQELNVPAGLTKFCSVQTIPGQKDRCYLSLIYVLTAQFNFDTEKIQNYCLGLESDRQARCFANASSRMIETDSSNVAKSVSLCTAAESRGIGETCYQELLVYSTYNFHAGSKEFLNLCNALPGEWKTKCLKRV